MFLRVTQEFQVWVVGFISFRSHRLGGRAHIYTHLPLVITAHVKGVFGSAGMLQGVISCLCDLDHSVSIIIITDYEQSLIFTFKNHTHSGTR